jgi:YD repeat-containing protein
LKYRAWGALKSLTYGNQMTLSQQFNNRLQLTQFVVGDLTPPPGAPPAWETRFMSSDYQYYADGNLRSASDNLGDVFSQHIFTRAYAYDKVGGAKEASSGSEALDFLNGTSSGTATGPYRQSFQHDSFGNITSNTSRFWSRAAITTNVTYVSNRKQGTGISYDAEGNLTQDADLTYQYDAAGRSTSISSPNTGKTITPIYDGDGQVVHRTEFEWSTPIPNLFQLRSTVLGGRVITELDAQGQKKHTYVYCNGQLIARQDQAWIVWQHETPFTGTRGGSNRDGQASIDVQLDSMGVDLGLSDPYPEPELWEPSEFSPIGLLPSSGMPSGRCTLDGIPVFCSDAEHLLQTGAAEFKKPDVAWQDGGWVFVRFNRETREYEKPVFSYFDYTSVKTEDGRESGKWHAVFEGVAVSETADLFRLFAFRPSRTLEQSKNKPATQPQKPALNPFLVNRIKQELEESDCAKFAETILNQLAPGKARSLVDVFNAFLNQPKPHDLLTRTKPQGSWGESSPIGSIKDSTAAIFARRVGLNQTKSDADNIIAELFHLARMDGSYTDKQLANAARRTTYASEAANYLAPSANVFDPGYKSGGWNEQNQYGYSVYFHTIQKQHCGFHPPNAWK